MSARKSVGERLGKRRTSVKPADLYGTSDATGQKSTIKKANAKPVVATDDKEPFSSSLRPSRKRKLKLYALALGKKDNEILEKALDEFFDKYKGDAQL